MFKKWIFFIALIFAMMPIADAQDSTFRAKFANCANKSESVRLSCYDELALKSGLINTTTEATSDAGNWEVQVDTSPMDDSKTVYISTIAVESIKVGYRYTRPRLHIRCKEGELNLYIAWGTFIGTGDANVTMRFGKNDAYDEKWGISTDRKATFASRPEFKLGFLEKADSFLARVTPYGESPILAKFDTRGLTEVSSSLKDVCNIR